MRELQTGKKIWTKKKKWSKAWQKSNITGMKHEIRKEAECGDEHGSLKASGFNKSDDDTNRTWNEEQSVHSTKFNRVKKCRERTPDMWMNSNIWSDSQQTCEWGGNKKWRHGFSFHCCRAKLWQNAGVKTHGTETDSKYTTFDYKKIMQKDTVKHQLHHRSAINSRERRSPSLLSSVNTKS